MTPNEYQAAAQRTSGTDRTRTEHLINGALGLTGESGEVADIVKKAMFQGHSMDYEHIAKELGDVLWYVAETATAIGYDMESIMQMNIDKLKRRYPNGFTAARSRDREKGDV